MRVSWLAFDTSNLDPPRWRSSRLERETTLVCLAKRGIWNPIESQVYSQRFLGTLRSIDDATRFQIYESKLLAFTRMEPNIILFGIFSVCFPFTLPYVRERERERERGREREETRRFSALDRCFTRAIRTGRTAAGRKVSRAASSRRPALSLENSALPRDKSRWKRNCT
jgi:hypothetical protein